MEVHRINCYGKDPHISTGKDLDPKYPPKNQHYLA